jgi:hypothetical protein
VPEGSEGPVGPISSQKWLRIASKRPTRQTTRAFVLRREMKLTNLGSAPGLYRIFHRFLSTGFLSTGFCARLCAGSIQRWLMTILFERDDADSKWRGKTGENEPRFGG